MDPKDMAYGCPNRVAVRDGYCCKALLGQPNKAECDPENCASLYIADLMVNDLRAEMFAMFENLAGQGGKNEDNESTTAFTGRNKS